MRQLMRQVMGGTHVAHRGLKFGVFLGPFHRLGENPTLAMDRDIELLEWMDHLGYDEAWIGEHHSAGWETIASPELIIARASDRTKHIRLGSGVSSLPYHHPLLIAQRFVQLDHMTRGRAMMGCGPGVLHSDAYMLGIEATTQRRRMMQSLDAITQLLKCEEPVTMVTDWFEMHEARLHLAPWSDPHFEIAVASTITPFGMIAAGTYGLSVLSIGAGLPGGPQKMPEQWKIAEDEAAKHGHKMDRKNWRIVTTVHLAEDPELALRQIKAGERAESVTYFEDTLGRPPGRSDDPIRDGVKAGTTLVGTPEMAIKGIESLIQHSQGGIGGILFRAHEWASREDTMKSFELFARYVMPHFQGSIDSLRKSNQWVKDHREMLMGPNVEAYRRAFTDAGRAAPEGFEARVLGGRDFVERQAKEKKAGE